MPLRLTRFRGGRWLTLARWASLVILALTVWLAIRTAHNGKVDERLYFGRGDRWWCEVRPNFWEGGVSLTICTPGYPPRSHVGSGYFMTHRKEDLVGFYPGWGPLIFASGDVATWSSGRFLHTVQTSQGGVVASRSWRISLPYGPVAAMTLSAVILGHWAFVAWRRRNQSTASLCPCGYDLRAHQPGQCCPECGTLIAHA